MMILPSDVYCLTLCALRSSYTEWRDKFRDSVIEFPVYSYNSYYVYRMTETWLMDCTLTPYMPNNYTR